MRIRLLKIFFFIFSFSLLAQQKDYELKSIEFLGNSEISSTQLKIILNSKESPNWASKTLYKYTGIGSSIVYFDSLLVPSDIASIKTLYLAKGFFKIKASAKYELNAEEETAKLIFTIQEGEQSLLKKIYVKGLDSVTTEFKDYLLEKLYQDSSKYYDEQVIANKNNYVLNYLNDHGYMRASSTTPTVLIDTIKNTVDVKYQFSIGNRFKIGEINVTRSGAGKESVEDNLIREVVDIKPGNTYSSADIRRGQVRLLRTNLFSTVYPKTEEPFGNVVPLSISVDVNSMNELSPEIKSSNEENIFTLGAGLSYIRKNFFGSARKFTIGSSIFYDIKDGRVSIEQPFLFGQPITTKLESYYTLQKRKNDYNATLFGAKLSLDFELPEWVYFNSLTTYFNLERGEYTYEKSYLTDLASTYFQNSGSSENEADSLGSIFVESLESRKFSSTNAILGASFGANYTDNFLYPTSGYSLSFLLEDINSLAYLFSKLSNKDFTLPQSVKFVVTSTIFPQVFESKTRALGFKFKLGEIITYRGDKSEVPINQRLYAGGSNSIRGWGVRELVPRNQLLNLSSSSKEDLEAFFVKGAASGGFFLFEGSAEIRSMISSKVGTALFLDYGNTWNDIREFRYDQIAVAAGIGFRYHTEYIPLRLDIGFKVFDPSDTRSMFKKKLWGELIQFHIGIGESF